MLEVSKAVCNALITDFYTVVMLLTFILIITSIQSPPRSFLPSFSANPSRPIAFLFFFRTDSTDSPKCLPILLSTPVFYVLVFFLFFHFLVAGFRAVD